MISTDFTEEPFALATPDGKRIYGTLNHSRNPNGNLVILSHGLTGCAYEYIHLIARDRLATAGYDVVQFNYYSAFEDARKLFECTIQTHIDDLHLIYQHFGPAYQKLFCCGHSYGGLTLLLSNLDLNAQAFWDPAYQMYKTYWAKRIKYFLGTDTPCLVGGSYHVINPKMIERDMEIDEKELMARTQSVQAPSLVVNAGNSDIETQRSGLFGTLTCKKKFVEVEGADHCFTSGHTVYELLNETVAWFDEH